MSEQINVGEVVEELSKPENKAELEQTLNDAFNETIPADAKTADAKPAENKESEDLLKDQSGKPDEAGESEPKKNRFESLLEDRNNAKAEAAEKQTEVEMLTKRVEDLTSLVEKLSTGSDRDATADGSADEPMTKAEVDAYLERKLEEKLSSARSQEDAEKSISDAIQKLSQDKETQNAKDYSDQLKSIMTKHPTLPAYAAYRMLQGEGVIPSLGVGSNANKTGTGSRSKTNLLEKANFDDLSTDQITDYLRQEEKAGRLSDKI